MIDTDVTYLNKLRTETLDVLAQIIGRGRDVALVDVPNQINVGDSLIWAGEIAYLRALGLNIRYESDLRGYEPESLRRIMPDGIILIHGGGNFGDIWEGHQRHRERIVEDFPDYKIVQLPQSVFFASRSRAQMSNRILRGHDDFHLLARESVSMERAAVDVPDVRVSFCHDMALGWDGPLWCAPKADVPEILVIARADVESASGLASITPGWIPDATLNVTDWVHLGLATRTWDLARRGADVHHSLARVTRHVPRLQWPALQPIVQRNLTQINMSNIAGGVALYDAVSGAVVDRLHAHIIAALQGIPHVLLDNNYGKLKAVYDDYSRGFSTGHYVTSLSDARDLAQGFGR